MHITPPRTPCPALWCISNVIIQCLLRQYLAECKRRSKNTVLDSAAADTQLTADLVLNALQQQKSSFQKVCFPITLIQTKTANDLYWDVFKCRTFCLFFCADQKTSSSFSADSICTSTASHCSCRCKNIAFLFQENSVFEVSCLSFWQVRQQSRLRLWIFSKTFCKKFELLCPKHGLLSLAP